MTIEDLDFSNPVLLVDGYVAFSGGYSNVYGVANYKNGTLWISKGKTKFHGLDSDRSSLAVQLGKELHQIDIETGERLSSQSVSGTVEAMGEGWILVKTKKQLILHQDGIEPIAFPLINCAGEAVESNGHIIVNDRQGPLRVVLKGTNKIVQEITPEPNSEYSNFTISSKGLLTYTQHYFDEPTATYVHQRLLDETEDLNLTVIGLSGVNHLIKEGAEVMFATCCIYSTSTGEKVASF
ncbi:hypothetical protein [Rubritalea sp.]|uniref:hypothetical protein n=1 Tax=Rubritalea sp. TaxID=2109375 RepID=UPI003EF4B7E8